MSENALITYYESAAALDAAVPHFIAKTQSVLDIGCGIRPQAYFRPQVHICIEPYQEYIDILQARFQDQMGLVVLKGLARDVLAHFPDKSIDSLFMIDVIEHIEKDEGQKILAELVRVAKRQAIIFTPYGFMPQHYEHGDKDAWGLSGTEFQEHRSGWLPEDFAPGWEFHVCKNYHKTDSKLNTLETPFGAFWGVYNAQKYETRKALPVKTLFVGQTRKGEIGVNLDFIADELDNYNPGSFGIAGLHYDARSYGAAFLKQKRLPDCPISYFKFDRLTGSFLRMVKSLLINLRALFNLGVLVKKEKYDLLVSVGSSSLQHRVLKLVAFATGARLIKADPAAANELTTIAIYITQGKVS